MNHIHNLGKAAGRFAETARNLCRLTLVNESRVYVSASANDSDVFEHIGLARASRRVAVSEPFSNAFRMLQVQLRRFAVVMMAAFGTYKLLIAACSRIIPGQPFYGFHTRDWFEWLFSTEELLSIGVATAVVYAVLSAPLARFLRTTSAAGMWGAVFGVYVGLLTYPLDLLSKLDARTPVPEGLALPATLLELGLFGIVVPLVFAFFIGRVASADTSPLPSTRPATAARSPTGSPDPPHTR